MHKCALCSETFNQFFLYTMHKESHKIAIKDYGIKRPYTKSEFNELVSRGEHRLGIHNFYGGR
jgi:hypothetical protein